MKKAFFLLVSFLFLLPACNRIPLSKTSMPSSSEDAALPAVIPVTQSTEEPAFYGQLLLNEINYSRAEGAVPYIELINAGNASISAAGMYLQNQLGSELILPEETPLLLPGKVLLIRFDGDQPREGYVLHLPAAENILSTSGMITLYNKLNQLLDDVAWGKDQQYTVQLGRGGIQQDLLPGESIGRVPGMLDTDRRAWVTYAPDEATPGKPNMYPRVGVLFPSNGAVFGSFVAELAWYLAPGTQQYHLQVASDENFNQVVIDKTVDLPPEFTDPLNIGTYYWRVQAVAADGTESLFSPVQDFTILSEQDYQEFTAPVGTVGSSKAVALDIPLLYEGKDSPMLLLESTDTSFSHAWNKPHLEFDPGDPADYANGALASLAMINHYLGGNLTQDRIGYEIYKGRLQGPELDLSWLVGPTLSQVERAFNFAVGGEPEVVIPDDSTAHEKQVDAFWQNVVEQIDADQPLLLVTQDQAVVVSGYLQQDAERYLFLIDPAYGSYAASLSSLDWNAYMIIRNVNAPRLESGLTVDSDLDGILDFDEAQRFNTNPYNADSDGDGIPDGADVFATVFDPQYGYSHGMNPMGRDFDMDGLPAELDPDSDNGGCLDGYEDMNADGRYNPAYNETWNFDPQDDTCYQLSMDWTFDDRHGETQVKWDGSFRIMPDNKLKGLGYATLENVGPCTVSQMIFTFDIKGYQVLVYEEEDSRTEDEGTGTPQPTRAPILVDQYFSIQIDDKQGPAVSTFDPEELDCSLGETIQENWIISWGTYAAIPEEIETDIPRPYREINKKFRAGGKARRGTAVLTVRFHQPPQVMEDFYDVAGGQPRRR